jgi:hypothetical protein
MTADEKTQRDAGSIPTDQIGKVFAVLSQGLLECLICGEIFTRQTAAEHAEVDCYPSIEFCLLESSQGGNMSLKKEYVRDGNRKIIGSVTGGFSGGTSDVVRDEHNEISGRTSEKFQTTRDGRGNLVSTNASDPGLLIKRKK